MIHRIAFLLGLLFAAPAFAADNATLITPCASGCVTMRSKDIGAGVQSMVQILGDTSGNAIYGTAGTANANVLSVQGIASGTALPMSAASLPLPTGAATAALQGTNSATTAHTCSVAGYSELGCLGQIDDDVKGAAAAGTNRIGYVSDDPCTQLTKTNVAIATATGTTQVVAPSGSTQVYVCSVSLVAGATAVVNLVGGTGATCTTGTPVAAIGSTTAANGMSLAANGGLTFGNGGATVVRTTTAGHGLCLIQSGTTALAGNITYIQQ